MRAKRPAVASPQSSGSSTRRSRVTRKLESSLIVDALATLLDRKGSTANDIRQTITDENGTNPSLRLVEAAINRGVREGAIVQMPGIHRFGAAVPLAAAESKRRRSASYDRRRRRRRGGRRGKGKKKGKKGKKRRRRGKKGKKGKKR